MQAPTKRRRRRGIILAAFVALLLASGAIARFYTDVLWFREVGFTPVLWKSLGTQFGLGLGVGIVTALFVWGNLKLTQVLASPYAQVEIVGRVDPFDRYRDAMRPFVAWIRIGVAAFVGFSVGAGAGAAWESFLLWSNRVPFGQVDPQFGKDVSFYVFSLPFYAQALDWVWYALVAALITSLAGHYFYGSIRPEAGLRGFTAGAMAHGSVLLGLLALDKAAQYWLGQYQLNFSPRGQVTGASYTDVHAQLPALKLLVIVSVISALLFVANIFLRRIALPVAAVGIWILVSVLAGGIWPWAIQNFSVKPQELPREREFIERNIAATRDAFDLADVTTQPYTASTALTSEDAEANQNVLQNVRLWDPGLLQRAYAQLQAIRTYYDFHDVDIDRYPVGGEMRQVLLAARELFLDNLEEKSKTWSNLHLQYTHGFGLIASLANSRTSAGQPAFLVKDVPGTVSPDAPALAMDQPRIYYGEGFAANEYSVVNTQQDELDYPSEEGVVRSNYDGAGGVEVGSFLRRIAFALREGDPNLVLSSLIERDSKILYYRNVRDRVRRAAPFLSLDHDPYVAVVDGRLVWIIDAYTTTNHYPYSQRVVAGSILGGTESGTLRQEINYIRNSVKVVVDAYDGEIDFYVVDDDDPVIATWRNAFPSLFTAGEPSEDLKAHFRYPEDLFLTQSQVYLTYHMTDPDEFYAKEDAWAIPGNPLAVGRAAGATPAPQSVRGTDQPATYLLTQLPGETSEEFVLIRPFTPRAKNNMISLFLARSDPEHYGELLTLEFPSQKQVPGPIQVDNIINQDPDVSRTITLLSRSGSRVEFGSLITLPIEDAILYVQPLFVTAENVGIPELKRIILVLGEDVVMEETFDEALARIFGDAAPPTVTAEELEETIDEEPADDEPATGLEELIAEAGRIYEEAREALAAGDFETYGRLIDRLGRILAELQDATSE